MARKPRVVPFVPFPRDGDLDGLVQDGTIWERPKGAYLRFIDTGEIWSEYGQVDRGRVEFVRADGSVWDFTPSFRDTDSTTLGGSLGTLADDSPSLLESQGILPRGVLGPSLAESARFDDAVDDVDVVDVSTDKGSAALAAFRPKIEYLLSDEAVESGLITQASQDRLRGLNNIPVKRAAAIDIAERRNRITLFQYMEERLHGKPTGRSGESPSYRYANFTLGESMAAMLRDGDRQSISRFRSRLKFLEDEARRRRRSVADMIETVDEDDVRFLQAMAAALPVTTWHDHHIKELINAYAADDFDKVRYHADWLDRNTASTGSTETHLGLANQLQYMADNPELIDRLFLQNAGFKDYEYYTGHAFRRRSDSIGQTVASAKSDLAARRADEATELSSTLGIIPENRLVERAGELSGQYQNFDVISQVLRDIETGEIAIQRLEADGEHPLASQLRERLAELKTELKEVTKPQDIKVVFTEETLKDKKMQGILRFIPGGAENEDLLRKIRKSTDGLSPEYRPTELRIELLDDNKIGGTFNSATGVLVLTPQMLGLDEHLVIDRKAGTIKRFNPDDGPDGVDIPLGLKSLATLGRLRNDFQEVGLSETPLDQVAVHEAVHRIDSLLAADAFFREKIRLEGEIENIQKQIDDPENARRVTILTETLSRRQEALRELDRQERNGDYIFRNDSPIRQAPQQWISENRPWLETYNRDFELRTRSTDHAYVSSILGYTPNDYIQIKYGVSQNTPGLDPLLKRRMERTESMEVLAEVISAHVTGRRRIPAGTDGEESNLPQMFDKYSKQIIPEELKFILTDRDWSEDDLPPLTALAGRQEADTAYSTYEARRVVRDVDQGKQRGSLLPRVASDPSATSQMLSDAESEDRKNRILGELAQAQVDEPELFRDGVLVDKVWAPFSPPPHLAGSGLRDELAEATSWREVSQLLKGKRVVVFDTETAGRMDPDEVDEDRIVQLGGVVYVDGVIVDRFSMYVNVEYDELSDWSQANLIDADGKPMSPEFLAKQPDMPTVLQEFMRFANGDSDGSDVVFMAHNAAFDLKRMELERQRHDPDGVPSFDLDEVTYFDTMGLGNIAKRAGVEDGPGSASLKKLQEFFGLEDFSWHTADADSEMTGQVLWRLLDYMDENDVPLDGLDPVAGLERQREEFAEYEGKIPEFLRQKERLAELRGLSDQLRSDRDDAVSEMIDDLDDAEDEVASVMARSVDDIVPESTEIPGGGVVETDDGGFWVPGPPPVGYTEEGKVTWERGVELLRERPELFKTQVIADDGLPVPRDERPGLADIGSVYDALPSDDADAAMTVRREIEKAWQAEITRAIVLNKIDIGNPREVWGTENDERSEAWQRYGYSARAERGMWENLPQVLLHVTTGLSGLQDGGFKTRAQLRDESGEVPAGLGGGVSDAISFTTDPLVADSIVRGIHEMREAVRDDTGPAAVERMKSEIAAWTKSMPENERKRLLSATPSTMEERGDFYREYSYWRQYNVPNRPDPLFWTPNYQAYADLDPNEVGVVTVNPSVDGARGWQVSGMGEWRTIPEAVEIVQSEARPTIVDDMTATLDELDTVRSSAPDFGLPPGPEKLTGWDKDRLTGSSVPDIHEGKPRPVADVVDGVHLREDQKALKTVVAELSTEDDLLPLQKKLEEAFELGGSLSGKQRTDATYEIFAAINDLITSRQRDTTGFTPSQMREYEKEVTENEAWVGSRIAKAIQIHWGEARSEVFHWDFLSERVKTVLGEEFDIDVSHEPSEIDAGIEEIFEIQELLTPFIDAWVRGQYSTTQKYLEDAGITELSVFRGTYIPNVVGDDDGLPSGREPSVTRGLESWSTDIGIALGFAGNKYGTADDRIEQMAEVGELGEPTHVLQHDVVPAQLIMGIGYLDNPRITTGSLGQGEESEIVVLGSSRPVNWLSNDLLKPWRSERPEGGYNFNIKEAAVFAYLSTGLWPRFS